MISNRIKSVDSFNEMIALISTYETDRATLERTLPLPLSSAWADRLKRFLAEWEETLEGVEFETLTQTGRVDYLLLRNHLAYERRQIALRERRNIEMAHLLPFAPALLEFEAARRRMENVDPAPVADLLHGITGQDWSRPLSPDHDGTNTAESSATGVAKEVAYRAALATDDLLTLMRHWFTYYDGYDPLFSWWVRAPFRVLEQTLEAYATRLREQVVGLKQGDTETIVGNPIGREALLSELEHECIPYTPEELIAIGDREFAWCEAEMLRASRDLGCGDDCQLALERVKSLHVPPGQQTTLVRDLALEAIQFVEERDLVTIPPLARECWRMEMMSPERQKVSPFFLGGETIIVSFPTDGMSHERKRMSLRGNNRHFARATVQHELIPGHHLQLYMADRHSTYRRLFHTPFYVEGWAIHWEMLLWDLGFPQSPEDRIGMLFWRMHRCARITFSLRFHLGEMTPQECIDFLVERVGHERENATGEVRRSFGGDYPPLYQCAYMLGGLQMRSLYQDLVGTGRMSAHLFHDTILRQNAIPIELIRAELRGTELTREWTSEWRF